MKEPETGADRDQRPVAAGESRLEPVELLDRQLAVNLLAIAANAWASHAPEIAERICSGVWALIADAEFVDDDEVNR